jgi:hypothetical protein
MKNKLSPYKHLVLTHADVDGMISAINVYNIIKDPDQKNTKFKSDNFGLVEDSVIKLVKTFMNYKNNKQDIYMTPYKSEIVKTFWNLYRGDRLFRERINRYTKKNNIEFDLYDI